MQKESSPASSPSSNNITYAAFSWRCIKIWTCFNEIIVQQWLIIRVQDIVTFGVCNNDFIFVMSTCRFFITPGRGQGARSVTIPVSGLRRAAPQQPFAKQRWGMLSPCAQNIRVYWLARQIEHCRSAQAALPKRICWEPWWLAGYCLKGLPRCLLDTWHSYSKVFEYLT